MLEITWRDLYRVALFEPDPVLHAIRVRAAANAGKAQTSEAGILGHERRELGDALAKLSRLKPCATI